MTTQYPTNRLDISAEDLALHCTAGAEFLDHARDTGARFHSLAAAFLGRLRVRLVELYVDAGATTVVPLMEHVSYEIEDLCSSNPGDGPVTMMSLKLVFPPNLLLAPRRVFRRELLRGLVVSLDLILVPTFVQVRKQVSSACECKGVKKTSNNHRCHLCQCCGPLRAGKARDQSNSIMSDGGPFFGCLSGTCGKAAGPGGRSCVVRLVITAVSRPASPRAVVGVSEPVRYL